MQRGLLIFIITLVVSGCTKAREYPSAEIPQATKEQQAARPAWDLRVATFNVWGLKWLSRHKKLRMPAIGQALKERDLDFAFLQEAWLPEVRDKIFEFAGLPFRFHHFVRGTVGSGLYQLSAHPMVDSGHSIFTLGGRWEQFWEGEAWAAKGINYATVQVSGVPVSLFNSHMIARYQSKHSYSGKATPERLMQLFELFEQVLLKTQSDAFVVGGDLNARIIHEELDFWHQLTGLQGLHFEQEGLCTHCDDNAYNKDNEGQIDHIYISPRLKFVDGQIDFTEKIQRKKKMVNLSDHYGVSATIELNEEEHPLTAQQAKVNFEKALIHIRARLLGYLDANKWRPDYDKGDKERFDKVCLKCNIKESLAKVEFYQNSLLNPNTAAEMFINERLRSYFSLFD